MAGALALVWELIANDNASAAFTRVGSAAEINAAKTSSMAGALTKVGEATALAGVVVAAASLKMAADYQQNLTKLVTTAGETKDHIAMVGQGMLDMAGQVGIGANDLAKAMYIVESSGIHGADSLLVLKAAAEGAKQEQADLGHVTDAVTTALHDYNLPASDAAKVTSQLVTAVSHGKTTFDDLTGAMHSLTPIAAAAHISLADAAGALSAMTASGMSAEQASQNLASSIRSLSAPTQPMIQELSQLGLNAVDLSHNLGTTGLAGTLQEVATAIATKMGPQGTVLLSALNQNALAGQAAAKAFDVLSPAAQKVATSIMNGTLSYADFRKTAGGLDVEQRTQVVQWAALNDKSVGLSGSLKTAANQNQNFTEAMKRATGTSEGLNVALQLTGEHTTAVNAAIKDIATSTAQADGNIKGWDEVQGNFNQKLSEVIAGTKSWFIELGQHLLPKATEFLVWLQSSTKWLGEHEGLLKGVGLATAEVAAALVTYTAVTKTTAAAQALLNVVMTASPMVRLAVVVAGVSAAMTVLYNSNKTFHDFFQGAVVPALDAGSVVLRTTATAVADVAKFFASLPGPVQAAVGALVAFRLATVVLGGTMTAATSSVTGFMRSIGNSTAFNTMGTAYLGASEKATMFARTQGTVAAASSGVKLGLSSVTSALGGPWGIAIAGATLLLANWANQNAKSKSAQDAAKASVDSYTQAFKDSHGVVDQSIKDKLALEATNNGLISSNAALGISAKDTLSALAGQGNSADVLRKKLQSVIDSNSAGGWKTLWNNLNDSDLAANSLRDGLNGTGQAAYDALKQFDAMSETQKKSAAGAKLLSDALGQQLDPSTNAVKDAQSRLNDAMQQGADKFTILNKGALDQSSANDSLEKAYNSLTDSVHQNGAVIDGNSAAALSNRDAVKSAIQALSDKVQADYTANLSTMTLTQAQDAARLETDQGKEALIRIAGQLGITGSAFDQLTSTIHAVPTQHDIDVTNNALASQNAIDLLSSSIHSIPAQTKIAIDIAAGQQLNKDAGFTNGPNADGNIYSAFANGGLENHVAQIAPKSGRGRLWAEDETGGEAYIPLSPAKRARSLNIWHQTGKLLGAFADGGITSGVDINVTTDLSAAMQAVKNESAARKAAASVGGVIPSGEHLALIDAALAADGIPRGQWGEWEAGMNTLIGRESGWNAGIVNNWDSNAAAGHPSGGLTQTIRSTFDLNRNPNLPYDMFDPVANIAASINYINSTYGGIGNVQQANANLPAKGYDAGGLLMPGLTMAYNGTGTPEVITPPGAGQFGGKDVIINVYSQPGQSGEQIAAEVKRQLLFEMR